MLTAAHVVDELDGSSNECYVIFNDPNNLSSSINTNLTDDGNSLTISDGKGKKMQVVCMAKLVAIGKYHTGDPAENFALLRVSGINADKHTKACQFARSKDAKINDNITVIGYPNEGTFSQTPGTISQQECDGNKQIFVTSAKAWHGNSGGALLDANNNLLGVVTSIGTSKTYNDGQTYVIKIDYIRSRLMSDGFAI